MREGETSATLRSFSMKQLLTLAFALALFVVASSAQAPAKDLQIYLVDVEGGNATLFVAPSGESVLIDTGNGGRRRAGRRSDHGRRRRTPASRQIDHLITTHWHGDHFGAHVGARDAHPDLDTSSTTGRRCNRSRAHRVSADDVIRRCTRKAKHTVVKPGDRDSGGAASTGAS